MKGFLEVLKREIMRSFREDRETNLVANSLLPLAGSKNRLIRIPRVERDRQPETIPTPDNSLELIGDWSFRCRLPSFFGYDSPRIGNWFISLNRRFWQECMPFGSAAKLPDDFTAEANTYLRENYRNPPILEMLSADGLERSIVFRVRDPQTGAAWTVETFPDRVSTARVDDFTLRAGDRQSEAISYGTFPAGYPEIESHLGQPVLIEPCPPELPSFPGFNDRLVCDHLVRLTQNFWRHLAAALTPLSGWAVQAFMDSLNAEMGGTYRNWPGLGLVSVSEAEQFFELQTEDPRGTTRISIRGSQVEMHWRIHEHRLLQWQMEGHLARGFCGGNQQERDRQSVEDWCQANGHTDPFYQENRWWAFPPNAVMPVELTIDAIRTGG